MIALLDKPARLLITRRLEVVLGLSLGLVSLQFRSDPAHWSSSRLKSLASLEVAYDVDVWFLQR
jgi:hypothetical protein